MCLTIKTIKVSNVAISILQEPKYKWWVNGKKMVFSEEDKEHFDYKWTCQFGFCSQNYGIIIFYLKLTILSLTVEGRE